ncbi:carbohydrate kinase family protein [Streptomyces sp. ODS28]|uniref:carbohydrate kinase family protein n=1 Tax=Streptomyces sp. ODS28 TaxID=3136688 RepID=UPI0031EABCDF
MRTAVIGNISRDHIHRPGQLPGRQLGGAALHLSIAAVRAGHRAAPVAALGPDLSHLPTDPRLFGLDWSLVHSGTRASTTFTIRYDEHGTIRSVDADYAIGAELTEHALKIINQRLPDAFHISCRKPLDVPAILQALTAQGRTFSLDFHLPSAPQMIPAAAAWLHHAVAIFANAEEHRILSATLPERTCREVIVSDGPRAARVLLHGHLHHLVTPPTVRLRQLTGAGDTLAGTYLALRARGQTPAISLDQAVRAATRYTTQRPLPLPTPRRPQS